MQRSRYKSFLAGLLLIALSAGSSGFLAGRTVKLKEEGKFEQLREVSGAVIDVGTFVYRGVEVIKRIVLR